MKWQTLISKLKANGYDGTENDLAAVKSYVSEHFGAVQVNGQDVDIDDLHAKAYPPKDSLDLSAEAHADSVKSAVSEALSDLGLDKTDKGNVNKTHDVKVNKDAWEDDPNRGFSSERDFFLSVMNAKQNGKMADNLKSLRVKAAGADEQGEYSDPYGGFLVPEGMYSGGMLKVSPESDPTQGRVRTVPMDAPRVPFISRVDKNHSTSVSGGLTVSRRAETGTASTSRMEMEKVTLNAASLFGVTHASEELIADSPTSLAALLADGYADEFASQMFNERINGTGVGEFLGVLNGPATIEVAKEGGQAADTLTALNIIKMRARMWGYGNAIWIANHDTYVQLAQAVIESANNAGIINVFQPSLVDDRPDMLLGRPIFFSEYAKTLGDKGDIMCVNWGEYLEGTLQPLQSAESMHVRFLEHERTFKFWTRNDAQPWWRSALTPKNGASTLSPFVTLAERA